MSQVLDKDGALAHALQRAAAAREGRVIDLPPIPEAARERHPRPRIAPALAAGMVAAALLAAILAVWHLWPSPTEPAKPAGLKLDHHLKGR